MLRTLSKVGKMGAQRLRHLAADRVEAALESDQIGSLPQLIRGRPFIDVAWSERSARPDLAAYIDHTLLKPAHTKSDIEALCAEARQHFFAAVCVPPNRVKLARKALKKSPVKVATVVGFPLGYNLSKTKAYESERACAQGADEIDMVLAVSAIKEKEFRKAREDIARVVRASGNAKVKVILETVLLNKEEIRVASLLSAEAGAAFVKTCTGFMGGGATVEDVALMRATVGPTLGVKASGGVRSAAEADAMIKAGANRIGTSSGVSIIGF